MPKGWGRRLPGRRCSLLRGTPPAALSDLRQSQEAAAASGDSGSSRLATSFRASHRSTCPEAAGAPPAWRWLRGGLTAVREAKPIGLSGSGPRPARMAGEGYRSACLEPTGPARSARLLRFLGPSLGAYWEPILCVRSVTGRVIEHVA